MKFLVLIKVCLCMGLFFAVDANAGALGRDTYIKAYSSEQTGPVEYVFGGYEIKPQISRNFVDSIFYATVSLSQIKKFYKDKFGRQRQESFVIPLWHTAKFRSKHIKPLANKKDYYHMSGDLSFSGVTNTRQTVQGILHVTQNTSRIFVADYEYTLSRSELQSSLSHGQTDAVNIKLKAHLVWHK